MSKMISLVIPIYNEEVIIDQLYKRLIEASPSWKEDFEIVLVDDGSDDNSYQLLSEIALQDERVKVVKLSRNFGHQAAISAGMEECSGDAVIIMDGDLQDPPEELHRFLEKWREGYEIVYAIRENRKEGLFKKSAYFVFYRILKAISNIDMPLDSGDFCLMDRKVLDVINDQLPENIRFVRGLRAYAGFKQIGVRYERRERAGGEPKYTFRKLMGLALDGIFGFSVFPLRIATYLGVFISLASFMTGMFYLVHRILDFKLFGFAPTEAPGFATLVVSMFFLGGVNLIILGIIGEYLGRIYIEVKRRPFYIVDRVLNQERKEEKVSMKQ